MPGAARIGDPGIFHCSPYTIASGSQNVIINGRGAARVGDSSSVHLKPGGKFCVPHSAKISRGSRTVKINNRPAARRGDPLGGCTAIAGGSGDVIIGA